MDEDYDQDEYAPIDEGYGSASQPGFEPMEGPGLFDDVVPEQDGPSLFADEDLDVPEPGAAPLPPGVQTRTLRTDEEGLAQLELPPLPQGGYRVTARAVLGGRPADDSEVFLVRGTSRELEILEADDRQLRLLSEATGGEARGADDDLEGLKVHPPHVVHVNQHRDVELWNNLAVLLVAVGCLAANWTLRRRWGHS